MIFTLEALEAKHGDALLLHYGAADPRLTVIDGGPSGVYRASVKPRLDELRAVRSPNDPLPIDMLMVSHLDDDHINGVLALLDELADKADDREQLPYDIRLLWHNSFDDITGPGDSAPLEELGAGGSAAAFTSRPGLAVAASVNQGRQVRDRAQRLNLAVNSPFGDLVALEAPEAMTVRLEDGVELIVLGPGRKRIDELHEEWQAFLARSAERDDASAQVAAYLDDSIFNLSSIVVLARARDRTMLLTGDARGDDIKRGLTESGLLKEGSLHVDVLKLPHHGSDRNVETEFFEAVTADHYVISADGRYGNPEIATLQMISEARGRDEFTIHLTHEEPRLVEFFERERIARKAYGVDIRSPDAASVKVELADSLGD
jgi:hypothetical protein